jgi:hypothetical protein
MRELLLSVLLWIVPGKFVLVQPAPPVDNKGNTEHFSAARHDRVCVRAGFLSEDLREYKHYFCVLLDGVGVGVSGRSRSRTRSLRWWCGRLQNGYVCDRDCGYTLRSESCRQGIPDAVGSLGGTRCASRFPFSGLLRIVMCGGERDWLTEENERVLPGSIRMLLGLRGAPRVSLSPDY